MIQNLLNNVKSTILLNPSIQSCFIYSHTRSEVLAPAVFLEIAGYTKGSDPATEQLSLSANFEARVVVDSTIENHEITCQVLAQSLAHSIHLNSFGCDVTPAVVKGITRDFFKPEFDFYTCYLIEWSHEFHVGSSIFDEVSSPIHTIIINEVSNG